MSDDYVIVKKQKPQLHNTDCVPRLQWKNEVFIVGCQNEAGSSPLYRPLGTKEVPGY